MEFKDRLKELRKEKNLTQAKLASMLNYGYTAIANYESGRNTPKISDLILIANIFQVSVDYLIGVSDMRYTIEDIAVQKNIQNEMKQKNIELMLMDKLIIYFLYYTLKTSNKRSKWNEKSIEYAEQECISEFSKRFYFYLKNEEFREIILSQMRKTK